MVLASKVSYHRVQLLGMSDRSALMRVPGSSGAILLDVVAGQISPGRRIAASASLGRLQRFKHEPTVWMDTTFAATLFFNGQPPSSFIYRDWHDVKDASFGLGGDLLEHSRPAAILFTRASPPSAQVDFDWPAFHDTARGHVRVTLHRDDKLVGSAEGSWADRANLPLRWSSPLSTGTYLVTMTFTDDIGSEIVVSWPAVHIERPWYDSPLAHTLIAFGMIVGLFLVVTILSPRPTLTRWAPGIVALACSGATKLPALETLQINTSLLLALVGLTFAVSVPLGALDLTAFRILARAAPFAWTATLTLLLPRARRKLFAPHGRLLGIALDQQRQNANQEEYVALPASSSRAGISTKLLDPPREIAGMLLDRDAAPIIYIEAPGGRGKSALVRACLERLWRDFAGGKTRRVPVLCTPRGDVSIAKAVDDALNASSPLPDGLSHELLGGGIIVVVDGLTETSMTPDGLRNFVSSEEAARTPLLIAGRPDHAMRAVLERTGRTVVVEPCQLDEATLQTFVDAYFKVDTANGGQPQRALSERLKGVCRDPTSPIAVFLPILIRLAVRLGKDAESLPTLYADTFRLLLAQQTDAQAVLDEASSLCKDTFWKDGYRKLAHRNATSVRRALIKRLINASVLVPVGTVDKAGESDEVRFFHDSMQSYLAARGLFAAERWDALPRAAGFAKFVEVRDGRARSEVFEMCVHVFTPKEKLRDEMVSSLTDWADALDEVWLRKGHISSALDPGEIATLRAAVDRDRSAGTLLREAIALFQRRTAEPTPTLVRLYAQMASLACRHLPDVESKM